MSKGRYSRGHLHRRALGLGEPRARPQLWNDALRCCAWAQRCCGDLGARLQTDAVSAATTSSAGAKYLRAGSCSWGPQAAWSATAWLSLPPSPSFNYWWLFFPASITTGTQVLAASTTPWWTREKPAISRCRAGPWSPSRGRPFPSSISFPGSDRWAQRATEVAVACMYGSAGGAVPAPSPAPMCRCSRLHPFSLHPGEGDTGIGGSLRGKRWEPSAPLRSTRWNRSLHSTKPDGLIRTARGWSWSTLRGAGQPEDHRPKYRRQGSAFKTNHILFPHNKLSEGISNTLTIQSTQVWCQFHSRQSPERLSANVFTTVSDQTSEASFGLGQRIS